MSVATGDQDRLWKARTARRRLLVADRDADAGSRVGGRPPTPLSASPPRCPICGGPLLYVLTLAGDVLGEAVASGQSLSVLICRNTACRMKGHVVRSPSPIVIPIGEDAPRASSPSELDSPTEPRALTGSPPEPDTGDPVELAKIGGKPTFLQRWGAEEARRAGGDFLFQWYENAYPKDMSVGPYPFLFGGLFVFTRKDPAAGLPRFESPSAFWQNT
jgi:hypothetical protein